MLRLLYSPGACSLVAHIALEEAGAAYEADCVDIEAGANKQANFLTVNPKGRVPVLICDRGAITENCAILAYIAQTCRGSLAPVDDPFAFAEFQAFNLLIAATIHPLFRLSRRAALYTNNPDAAASIGQGVLAPLEEQFGLIEDRFCDARPWVHGDEYTLSDPYLAVFATYLDRSWHRRFGVPGLERFPALRAHRERTLSVCAALRALRQEGLGNEWSP